MESAANPSTQFGLFSTSDMQELCISLIQAETEKEVIEVLQAQGLWDDPNAWQFYGNKENNFSEIGNQQESADTALVEKIINCGDAMLLAAAAKNKVDPEGEAAPKSIAEALEMWFNIKQGKLSYLSAQERSALSENIGLVATGSKSKPNFGIFDFGVGQSPQMFPDTFLSLTASNKMRIHFVQGRFNMGSTGVFQFCGRENLQLIISKRHPDARDGQHVDDQWGFTVVRRERPKGLMKSSVYTYLAPNSTIPAFDAESLPILPGDYPNPYSRPMNHGTYVKVYEFDIGSSLRTNILFDLYNRLSLLLPNLALPVRLYERRKGYSGKSMEGNLSGLSVRLDTDRDQNLEKGFPSASAISVAGLQLSTTIYAFKPERIGNYARGEGVIFTINGQTHGSLDKAFFRRKKVGMSYLADSLLVLVDCSSIDGRTREDLFMNSRDRLRQGSLKTEVEAALEGQIAIHEGLKELRERRKREALENKLADSKPLADVLQEVLAKSPSLAALFRKGVRLSDPFRSESKQSKEEFVGQKFPSFFRLSKEFPQSRPKHCHCNFRFRVTFDTNADNDYFTRDVDPGSIELLVNGQQFQPAFSLWNGKFQLTSDIPENSKVGDLLKYEFSVTDVSRPEPLREIFYVKVITEGQSGEQTKDPKSKKPASKLPGQDDSSSGYLDIPQIAAVGRDEWDAFGFDQYSSLAVRFDGSSNSYDFFYNSDNVFLKTDQKAARDDEVEIIETQFKTALVLVGLAMIQGFGVQDELDDAAKDEEVDVEGQVAMISRSLAPILLPMIRSLGGLEASTE